MTRIFLIRHAEAEGNVFRRAHGHHDGNVTKKGHVQIGKLKERLIDEKIDAVYSSDLTRTRITSTAVTEPRGLTLSTSKELREVCMGSWEDVAWGDLEYHHGEMNKNFGFDPANWKVEGSESYYDVIDRMERFLTETVKRHDGETIAIVSHGFAIRSLLCKLMGLESGNSWDVGYFDNTAVALIVYDNGKFSIEFQADNSHLSDNDSTFAFQDWWREGEVILTENLRYMPLDEVRDKAMLEELCREMGEKPAAERELAAFRGDKPAGLIGVDFSTADVGQIKYIMLMPEFRNINFGVQLLGTAISMTRQERIELLRIEAPVGNHVIKLCFKHGFEVVSETDKTLILEKNVKNWND